MALGHFQSHALNGYAPISGATVTVTNELTGGLATLKSDYAGATPKSNGAGFVTDLDGYFDFFTTGGFYKIVVEKDGASKTWRYVPIGTLQGYDIEALLNFKRVTVRAATTANITISTALNNGDSLDGLTLATDDLVLVKDQTTKSENGVYKVAASPARASGYDAWNDYVGLLVAVSSGTANANTLWIGTNNAGGVLGTNDIVFTKLTVAGGNAPIDSPAFTGSFQWTGDITPTSLSADQDDYNPPGLSGAVFIRQATTAFYSINGLQGGSDGRAIIIKNAGSYPLQIGAERASSTAAYRFAMSADLLIGPGEAAMFEYDSTSSRWVLIGRKPRPEHLEVTPDPFPTVPHKPTVYADWSTMPWLDRYFDSSRSSEQRALDRKGVLYRASVGVPSFRSSFLTGATGLLCEGSRSNICKQSQTLQTTWSTTRASISVNAAVAPDGTSTADKLIEDSTASSSHFVSQTSISVTAGQLQTFSIYAKAAERSVIVIQFPTGIFGATLSTWFDLASGAVSRSIGSGTNRVDRIEPLADGWYRCSVTAQATSSGNSNVIVYLDNSPVGSASYSGNGTSGVYLFGGQWEVGGHPSSYIETTTATVVRAADVYKRNNNDGFLNAREGTLYLRAHVPHLPPSGDIGYFACLSNGSGADDYIGIRYNGTTIEAVVVVGGAAQASFSLGTLVANTSFKAAIAFKADDFAACLNGGSVSTDLSGSIPTLAQLGIGYFGDGFPISGFVVVEQLAYFPRRIANTHVQAVTT